jgi:hypothetical protein
MSDQRSEMRRCASCLSDAHVRRKIYLRTRRDDISETRIDGWIGHFGCMWCQDAVHAGYTLGPRHGRLHMPWMVQTSFDEFEATLLMDMLERRDG